MRCTRQATRHIFEAPRLPTRLPLRPVANPLETTLDTESTRVFTRPASSSSSTRWKSRQSRDHFARDAKVAGLKSRAAYKLLELDSKHRIFRKGYTVIDLGYAPGSWSQVAVNRTAPGGRVVGIDIIPAQPPRGASSIQGNFLSEEVREEVRNYVRDHNLGRARTKAVMGKRGEEEGEGVDGATVEDVENEGRGLLSVAAQEARPEHEDAEAKTAKEEKDLNIREKDLRDGRVVDVVLSDMSAPWEQTASHWVKSVSNPYSRMMNTSGMPFRDHAGSMDLCNAALTFCYDTLRTGGHFLCKYYQGTEEKSFELRLKKLFEKVHREKPESSRAESKEAYFVALRRKHDVPRELVFPDEYAT